MAKMSPFDWLNIINGKNQLEEDLYNVINQYDIFMMNRIMSNCPELRPLAEMSNRNGFTKMMHFTMMKNAYEKKFGNRVIYIEYPKSDKKDEDVKLISDYFQVNLKTAKEYLQFINKDELQRIKEHYKEVEKYSEVKKSKLAKKDM